MQPTEEQIKEFWEWCGLQQNYHGWYKPCPDRVNEPDYYLGLDAPKIDFNNLFKWAVPDDLAVEFMPHGNMIECKLLYRYSMNAETLLDTPYGWRIKGIGKAPTRILSLFWAIYTIQKKRQ